MRLPLVSSFSILSCSATSTLHQLVDGDVEIGAVLDRTGDDQRRARLVDQDRVDLVDDGEGMPALHHLRRRCIFMLSRR